MCDCMTHILLNTIIMHATCNVLRVCCYFFSSWISFSITLRKQKRPFLHFSFSHSFLFLGYCFKISVVFTLYVIYVWRIEYLLTILALSWAELSIMLIPFKLNKRKQVKVNVTVFWMPKNKSNFSIQCICNVKGHKVIK